MRIGVDISVCSFNNAGNARYSRCLLQSLQRESCDSELSIVPFNLPVPLRATAVGVRRKLLVLFWEFIYAPYMLGLMCRCYRCDLLHATAPMPVVDLPCPLVTTILDVTPVLFPEWFTRIMGLRLRRWLKISMQNATYIITISDSTARDVRRVLPGLRTPMSTTYLGSFLETSHESLSNADLPSLIGKESYILSVGTLEPRKNLQLTLEAYRSLTQRVVNPPRLLIVGAKGWMADHIETLTLRLGIADRVLLAGFVSDAQLRTLYANATMLVYPSLYEGFGFPILEAMNGGCPVITSNVSSLPEVIGDCGVTVDPHDAQQLANAMQQVLADSVLAQQMRSKGLARSQLFSWQRCARETLAVYREVLSTGH
jgi:glycosyltransferase involved in cell wall biosynthesis